MHISLQLQRTSELRTMGFHILLLGFRPRLDWVVGFQPKDRRPGYEIGFQPKLGWELKFGTLSFTTPSSNRSVSGQNVRACLYQRRDGTFTGTGRLSSRIYMNFLQAGQ